MLITKDFVLLNFPKTATTFARKIVKEVFKDDVEELFFPGYTNPVSQHGTYAQIPPEHLGKTIVSIIRNPFDRYVSQFFFRWFAQYPPRSIEVLKFRYPNFPQISFLEFLDMTDKIIKLDRLRAYDISENTDIGFQTIQFLTFYSSNPEIELNRLVGEKSTFLIKAPEIHFLRQEQLRDDLIEFLSAFYQAEAVINIVRSAKEENVSRGNEDRDWRKFWPAELLQVYRDKEIPLLKMFPSYE